MILDRRLRLVIVCAGIGYFVGLLLELLEQLADDRSARQASRIAAAQQPEPVVLIVRDPDATAAEVDEPEVDEP